MSVRDGVRRALLGPDMRRDPTAATKSTRFFSPGQPMVAEWNAEDAITFAYYANTYVYACISALARDISGAPLRVGRIKGDKRTVSDKAPLSLRLGNGVGGPNAQMTSRQLIRWIVAQYITTGRWACEIDTTARPPELWPLAQFKPIPTDGGAVFFSGYKVGRPGEETTLPPERVWHSWNMGQRDLRQPESPLQAGRLPISVAVMQNRYDYAFWKNDARPAAIVVHRAFEESDDRDAFRRQFEQRHQGPDQAGRLAFAEAGMDDTGKTNAMADIAVNVLGLTHKDAQALQQYQQAIQDICVAIGVPMGRLDASGRTYANAANEERNYYESRVIPLAGDIAEAINLRLAPIYGEEVAWFDFDHIAALRPPSRFAQVSPLDLTDAGVVEGDELRIDVGLAARNDGIPRVYAKLIDKAQAALALTQAGYDPEDVLITVGLPPMGLKTDAPDTPAEAAAEQKATQATEVSRSLPLLTAGRRNDAEDVERARSEQWVRADKRVQSLEGHWQRSWSRFFEQQGAATLARLEQKAGRQALRSLAGVREGEPTPNPDAGLTPDQIAGVFDRSLWKTKTEDHATDLYDAVVARASSDLTDLLDTNFDVHQSHIDEFVRGRANLLAGQVTDTTYSAIQDAMVEGVQAGEGIDDIAARIKDVFAEASDVRATTIARTEVVSAYNGAQNEVAQNLPTSVVAGREWLATRDGRTRPEHADADGQIVEVGQHFRVGGADMLYPGDPAGGADMVINCRCTAVYLTPDQMAAKRSRMVDRTVVLRVLDGIGSGSVGISEALHTMRA